MMFKLMIGLILVSAYSRVGMAQDVYFAKQAPDFAQVGKKYALYYKSFFQSSDFLKRNWVYHTSKKPSQLVAFRADGCSSFPDGTVGKPQLWRDCCIVHDFSYWLGGTKDQKKRADRELGACVHKRISAAYSNKEICDRLVGAFEKAMESGVSIGGTPNLYTPWRWGYGWPSFQGYRDLAIADKTAARKLMNIYAEQVVTKDERVLSKFGVPSDADFVLTSLKAFLSERL